MAEAFLAKQAQLEAKIAEWTALAGPKLQVDYVVSYSGDKVYALTLSDPDVDRERKRALYFAQPHAHEPGTTAGMIDVIDQLVKGREYAAQGADLEGRPTALDVDKVLAQTILTFNPIGNVQGREKAPVLCWDGSRYSNEEFWCWMRGEDPEHPGQMWKRLDIWDVRAEKAPDPIGIVYEQIDAFRYVEPNRSQLSSYFKLFHRMDARYGYEYWLNLHQTEFVDSEYNCVVLLPLEGLATGAIAEEDKAWAERIMAAWKEAGLKPEPAPRTTGYTGVQAEYFRRNWGALHERMRIISTEGKNNAADAPPEMQRDTQALAILESIERLLD